ncbi:serine protease inhibitor Kazal-type 6 [Halichoerus grypus]|uniref:serine protease inhibitor Kazal-type 6-like n=1 Tax=Phoca vitulina TaxID=9720 RepID=UPI001395D693|nr:serine protease inhibitor Kazal-type 6-like [Phoca vitulina]
MTTGVISSPDTFNSLTDEFDTISEGDAVMTSQNEQDETFSTTLFGFCAFFSGVFSQGGQIDCGEFRDPKVYCTRESNPHCGSDGQTYGNKCAFCKAMVKSGGKINLKHQGKC